MCARTSADVCRSEFRIAHTVQWEERFYSKLSEKQRYLFRIRERAVSKSKVRYE